IVIRRGACPRSLWTSLLPTNPAPPTTSSLASVNSDFFTISAVLSLALRRSEMAIDLVDAVCVIPLEHAPDHLLEADFRAPIQQVVRARRIKDHGGHIVLARWNNRHGLVEGDPEVDDHLVEHVLYGMALPGGYVEDPTGRAVRHDGVHDRE